ncbi:hypothetical protein HX792_08020 [Pseudomonas sp. B6002]|uniref:phage tail assembly chaperone n=1 Tax=Pseudomonas sp. B6002 TaxID=2726978 RepID=UPI0015A2AA27|nr:phage tail assembly chaperone [Pseudomonas sp. B6002]NVZ50275.1 hypothetical protein [Pseudomonas sp. B6002]
MSYAICVDRPAFRAVGSPDDVGPGEYWSQSPPEIVPSLPGSEALAVRERAWRDGELASLMWLRERHRDQLEISVETSLTGEQFTELLLYMQALRDWPQSPEFPDSEHRPVALGWIADQTQ